MGGTKMGEPVNIFILLSYGHPETPAISRDQDIHLSQGFHTTHAPLLYVHSTLQRRFQIVVDATARGERLLRLGLLLLPNALLVLGDRDVGLLGNLLLLGGSGGLRLGLLPDGGTEAHDFLVDHTTHLLYVVHHFEVEIEGCGARRLVRCVVPDVQVWVLQGLFNRDTRRGVEGQHAVEQVKRIRVGTGEQALEGDLGHERQVAYVLLGPWRADPAQGLLVRSAQVVQNLVELVDIVTTLEEGAAAKKFSQDATHGPHIDC